MNGAATIGAELGRLGEIRAEAGTRMASASWPTRSDEAWRRSGIERFDLEALAAGPSPAAVLPAAPPVAALTGQSVWAGVARFRDAACVELALAPAGAGARLRTIQDAVADPRGGGTATVLEREARAAADKVALWHYRSLSHGLELWIPDGTAVDLPFLVELDLASAGAHLPHLVVRLGSGARAAVVVRVRGGSGGAGGAALNGRASLELGEGARLRYAELHDLERSALALWGAQATVASGAALDHVVAALGGSLYRGELDCSLDGPGAEALLWGLYFATGRQSIDLRTVQRHRSPRASSRALYKGASRDEATTVFGGLIDVAEGARKTDAYLSNRNLVLGGKPRTDSIPSLAIRNDDLRCSHGSTTGRISPEERFYLMSRGLDRAEADAMIVEGYFDEVVAQVPPEAAEELRAAVLRRLGGEG